MTTQAPISSNRWQSSCGRSPRLLAALLLLCAAHPLRSAEPEIATGKVTFHVPAPSATSVTISGEWSGGKPEPMARDDQGNWTLTKELTPNIYSYTISIDKLPIVDPRNPNVKVGRSLNNYVEVPATPPAYYEQRNVPHGVVAMHTYHSAPVDADRRVVIYTPPGYDAAKSEPLPVLFLLHGSGDDESTWTSFGRAHLIADNLLAEGKMKPMIIVMPNGHANDPKAAPSLPPRERTIFREDLLQELIPLVEKLYRTKSDREHRAIMGLSMGGSQAFSIGLGNLGRFSHVGIFSSGGGEASAEPLPTLLANPAGANEKLKLLWIGCGRDDRGFTRAEELSQLLTDGGIIHTFFPSEGAHTWQVWRVYLHETLPLLFRD